MLPNSFLSRSESDFRRVLGVIMLSRWALNLQFRIVYPFLPVISRGLGISLEMAGLLLAVRALIGASSPLYGMLADRWGRRKVMLVGLGSLALGCGLMGSGRTFQATLLAFALLGVSKASYDPAMMAYVGDTVPYAQRGRVLGLLELSWALAWLIGVPANGFLIATAGWRLPFWIIAGLGLVGLVATWRWCEDCAAPAVHRKELQPEEGWRAWTSRARLGLAAMVLSVTCALMMACENVFIVYGAWLEEQFGLAVTALGLASMVISVAEFAAESASAWLVDRLGKRRAVLSGIILNALAYLLLPALAGTLGSALVGVALLFLTFEFSIVSLLPLVSELVPRARGTVMALNVAAMAAGRAISALIGPRLWEAGGLSWNTTVSMAIVVLAGLILWLGVREL